MRYSKLKISFFSVIIILFTFTLTLTSVVNSESPNSWKGYGLYNINDAKIEILNEDVKIVLLNDKVMLEGEFAIKNTTNSDAKVSLGVPANGVEKISMMEKGYYIKWRKRSFESLQNELKIENRLPQENYWYVFNITLDPAETRIINLKLDAVQQPDDKDAYTVNYFSDRKIGFSNQVERSSLYLKIESFEPYNILGVKGLDPYQISKKGEIIIETDEKNMETISLQNKDITALAVNRLLKSPMHKPREIALAFINKNYDRASVLCDEYLKNPNDNQISNEQILFVKAESQRRLYHTERYLQLVEALDYSKLYPTELKNKIYFDRMNIYLAQQKQEKIDELSKEVYLLTDDSSEFLTAWMDDNGYFDSSKVDKETFLNNDQSKKADDSQTKSLLEKWYQDIMSFPYTPALIFIAGLLAGLFLRKPTLKKKRRKSMYVYRM